MRLFIESNYKFIIKYILVLTYKILILKSIIIFDKNLFTSIRE